MLCCGEGLETLMVLPPKLKWAVKGFTCFLLEKLNIFPSWQYFGEEDYLHYISITTYLSLHILIIYTAWSGWPVQFLWRDRDKREGSKQDYSNILLIPHYLWNDAGSMRGCFYQVFSRWASSVKRALDELRLYAQNPPLTDLLPGRASQNIRNCSEKKVLQE